MCDEVSSRWPLVILLFEVDAKMKCLEHSTSFYSFNSQWFPKQLKPFHHNVGTIEIQVSILCSGALRNKTKEMNLPYTYKGFPLFYSPSLGAKNEF